MSTRSVSQGTATCGDSRSSGAIARFRAARPAETRARPERSRGSELRGLRRLALVRSDRAVPSCAACGVAKAARCATIGGGCQPRRATQEERARSRVQRARPRGRNPRSREDERKEATPMSAGSARVREAGTRGRGRTSARTQAGAARSGAPLATHNLRRAPVARCMSRLASFSLMCSRLSPFLRPKPTPTRTLARPFTK
jgi:hypothetical protein